MVTLKQIERYHKLKKKVPGVILKTLDDGEIIHGQRALNAHFKKYPHLRKETVDYDIFVAKQQAMKEAREAERKLDKLMGFKKAFKSVRSEIHPSTVKIKAITGSTVADFTVPDTQVPYKMINKRRYRTLESYKKHINETIKTKRAEFRREKDLDMLNRIKIYERLEKARAAKATKSKKIKRRLNLW